MPRPKSVFLADDETRSDEIWTIFGSTDRFKIASFRGTSITTSEALIVDLYHLRGFALLRIGSNLMIVFETFQKSRLLSLWILDIGIFRRISPANKMQFSSFEMEIWKFFFPWIQYFCSFKDNERNCPVWKISRGGFFKYYTFFFFENSQLGRYSH